MGRVYARGAGIGHRVLYFKKLLTDLTFYYQSAITAPARLKAKIRLELATYITPTAVLLFFWY